MKIQSNHLRKSANGEACCLNISGGCNYDDSTTVLAHLPSDTGGMGLKSVDICAVYACSACHDIIDSRRAWPGCEEEARSWYLLRGLVRTWERYLAKGLVTVKGVKI